MKTCEYDKFEYINIHKEYDFINLGCLKDNLELDKHNSLYI